MAVTMTSSPDADSLSIDYKKRWGERDCSTIMKASRSVGLDALGPQSLEVSKP